jgi:hypothetical protein
MTVANCSGDSVVRKISILLLKAQSELEFVQKRMVLAEAARTPPQAIPDWQVKTTLHRVVQVLKAHRNEHFRDELDMRPASILITTLAAQAYRGEQDLMEAVLEAVELMPIYIRDTDDARRYLTRSSRVRTSPTAGAPSRCWRSASTSGSRSSPRTCATPPPSTAFRR